MLKKFLIVCTIFISAYAFPPVFKADNTGEQAQQIPGIAADTGSYLVDTLASDLIVPWQLIFLPDRSILFTERAGRIRLFRDDSLVARPVFEIPGIPLDNKSGLLGLCLHPGFSKNRLIYVANNYLSENRMKLRITRYRFENDTITDPLVIREDLPANRNHTGCRLLFGPDNKLYITTGDADEAILSQDLKAFNGKILRLNDDGSIPADNPFVKNDTALKEIWSYGHRNPQGLRFQPGTNDLYASEHGPTGGDEVNRIVKGANYGWPVVHHRETRPGFRPPLHEYTPSVGPSEIIFPVNSKFPQFNNKMLMATLRGESLISLQISNRGIVRQDMYFRKRFGRIRSIVIGPDGYLYLSTSQNDPPEGRGGGGYDMILRLRPAPGAGSKKPDSVIKKVLPITDLNSTAKQVVTKSSNKTAVNLIAQLCGSCHGNDLKGTKTARGLINGPLQFGSGKTAIINNITNGIVAKGMPAWKGAISDGDIGLLTDYILAERKRSSSLQK